MTYAANTVEDELATFDLLKPCHTVTIQARLSGQGVSLPLRLGLSDFRVLSLALFSIDLHWTV